MLNILSESVTDHAKKLMASGKYDPAVKGSATKFKEDLKKTGVTKSDTTAQFAWTSHKKLHPKSNFNVHNPASWPEGYSHKGNPVHLD